MSQTENKIIRVGSRKSQLALIQTKHVIACLKNVFPDIKFEIHTMTTMGDRVLNKALPKIGEKSLFTKDLEEALTNGGVDFVVHSLKDLPTALPLGMAVGAILEREDPRDVLILNAKHAGKTLKTLPKGSTIGTSSLRRSAQLARSYKHLNVCDIRGNLNTRLAKLDAEDSKFDGIILALAGVARMGWQHRVSEVLEPVDILYAVGQGALAVECRSNDEYILNMLSKLCHLDTQCRILAERSFLKTLGGGCSAPVAVHTTLKRNHDKCELDIIGAVWSLNGDTKIEDEIKCELALDIEPPRKKQKVSHETVEEQAEQEVDLKTHSPPKIFDENMPSSSKLRADDKSGLLVEKLINIHGDLFKKCPYSKEMNKHEANRTETDKAQHCPLSNLPIGQDVMGECPLFTTTSEKVVASNKLDEEGGKCPISECPQRVENIQQCPFLHKEDREAVNLVEYDEKQKIENAPTLCDNSDILYCGLYCQKYVDENIFKSCENLGIQLANNLINKGALEVMHCAQNEIRERS